MWKLKIDGDTATNWRRRGAGASLEDQPRRRRRSAHRRRRGRAGGVDARRQRRQLIWGRAAIDPSNHARHGNDAGIHSDTWLIPGPVSANTCSR